MASRIEQLIEDIYEFIESCKMQPLSNTKVVVPKDELYDLLDELRLRTPDEIKRYQKIINNKDAIIADAQEKAEGIIKNAQEQAAALVNENEIMQQAYAQADQMLADANAQADQIVGSAEAEAEEVRRSALAYANDLLTQVENILGNAYESVNSKSAALVNSLKDNLDIVVGNRAEIYHQLVPEDYGNMPQDGGEANPDYLEDKASQDYPQDDFNFDENTFLNDVE